MSITIRAIHDNQLDMLLTAFNVGYEGYLVPMHLEMPQLEAHIARYDIHLGASRILYDGDEPVGMALLGIRGRRGWVGGVGIGPAYRGRGLGNRLMDAIVESARERHLERVQLEVLEGNTAAHELYKKIGFKDTRRLLILERQPASEQALPARRPATDITIEPETAGDVLCYFDALHTLPNPWQREAESLHAFGDVVSGWIAKRDGNVASYAARITNPQSIGWLDMAFVPGEADTLRSIIAGAHAEQPEAKARIVNMAENDPAYPLLTLLGYEETHAQYEMWRSLI